MAQTQEAAQERSGRTTDKSTADVVQDIWQLTKDYARQETVDPLKALGRFIGFGLAGALLLGLGTMFLSLALLRALQNETGDVFDGYFTWAPYAITLLVAVILAAWAASRIGKTRKKESSS